MKLKKLIGTSGLATLALAALGTMPGIAHADTIVSMPHGSARVGKGQRIRLVNGQNARKSDDEITLDGGTLELNGGDLLNAGTVDVPDGKTGVIEVNSDATIDNSGGGRIVVGRGSTLTITGKGRSEFRGGSIVNNGTLEWGKKGRGYIHCSNISITNNDTIQLPGVPFDVDDNSYGTTPNRDRFLATVSEDAGAIITNNGVIKGAGLICGTIHNKGEIIATPMEPEPTDIVTTSPDSGLIIISGGVGTGGGTLTSEMTYTAPDQERYGQYVFPMPVSLNGGTLKVTCTPSDHNFVTPPYDVIVAAINISGSGFAVLAFDQPFTHTCPFPYSASPLRKSYRLAH